MIEAPPQEPRELDSKGGVLIELVSRTFATKRGPVQALSNMSLRVAPREIVVVVGPSGCGKSTLLELICGLQLAGLGGGRLCAGGADATARPPAAMA